MPENSENRGFRFTLERVHNEDEGGPNESIKEKIIRYLQFSKIQEAVDIQEQSGLPNEVLNSPEVQEAIEYAIVDLVHTEPAFDEDYVEIITDKIKKLKQAFNLSEEFIQAAVKKQVVYLLVEGRSSNSIDLAIAMNVSDEIIASPEIQEAAKSAVLKTVYSADSGEWEGKLLKKLIQVFKLPEKDGEAVIKKAVIELLAEGLGYRSVMLASALNQPKEFMELDEPATVAKNGIVKALLAGNLRDIETTQKQFNLREDELSLYNLPVFIASIAENLDLDTFGKLVDFLKKEHDYWMFLKETPNTPCALKQADFAFANKQNLRLIEAEEIKRGGHDLSVEGENFDGLLRNLKETCKSWQDEQNVSGPFEAGANVFGPERMFAYLCRNSLSRHDGLHAFQAILDLQRDSGLTPNAFYGNILQQVADDDSQYESGTAHHQFNSLAQNLNRDFASVIAKAQEYSDIDQLQELTAVFSSPGEIFASWKNLKRYNELSTLLERTEILADLQELKAQPGKEKLYHYVETLAFHPNSGVDMGAIMQFWRNPEIFLDTNDEHTPEEVHNRKKPSNYLEIPHLDLTAEQLRDALVEGKMDELQVFTSLKIKYALARNEESPAVKNTRQTVSEALGSRKEGIEGQAHDPKKLFGELARVCKAAGLSLPDYLSGKDPIDKTDFEQQIVSLVYNPVFGLPKAAPETQTYLAKINLKSDPNGTLAGNDTACCMPFGSGKNNVYTFNPDTALFTLQIEKSDGTYRTIAQSVLTKDKDVKIPVPTIIEQMQKKGEDLADIVSENILIEAKSFLACDNVQVAPNFQGAEFARVIEGIYQDFFREYMSRHANEQKLNQDKIIIGQGYSDTLTNLPTAENTYVPLAPVGYSDKTGAEVFILDLTNPRISNISSRDINDQEAATPKLKDAPLKTKGLSYLTFEDTLVTAYIESKAYSDNASLMEYLHKIENTLIAKDINNTAKNKPNLCLKYTSKDKIGGYFIAYEGVINGQEENEDRQGTPVIYIADFATDKGNRMAGGWLVQGFVELYEREYLEKGNYIPIYTYAREQTSYRLIQKQLEKIGDKLHIEFDMEELPIFKIGGDVMHPIIIKPISKGI